MQRDLRDAWSLTDTNLRLVMVQGFLYRDHPEIAARDDRDEIADALASDPPIHPLWGDFRRSQIEAFQQGWGEYSHETWGTWSRPELAGPGLELVLFVETGGNARTVAAGEPVHTLGLLMRATETGWLVAGVGASERLPEPGWPPTLPARADDPSPRG